MRYSKLGNSGLVVSRLAFGAMTLGSAVPIMAGITGDGVNRLVGAALDRGINFFDTADIYHNGESETLLGQALSARRHEAVIATKVGMRISRRLDDAGLSARHILRSLDLSLQRLGTDWIDLYICHRPDPVTPLEETLRALDDTVRAGKVRYLGFSNWPAWLAAKAIQIQKANGWAPFVSGQMYYSLVARDIEEEYIPMALDAGVGTMVWSPLSSGFLSGKYTREDPQGAGGRLANLDLMPFDRERGYATIDVLRKIATSHDVSVAAVAIAWLLDRPSVSTAIIGFTSEAQFEANIAAAELRLTPEETAELDAISAQDAPYPNSFIRRFASDPVFAAMK